MPPPVDDEDRRQADFSDPNHSGSGSNENTNGAAAAVSGPGSTSAPTPRPTSTPTPESGTAALARPSDLTQQAAAQYTLARSSKSGRSVPNAVRKIAGAERDLPVRRSHLALTIACPQRPLAAPSASAARSCPRWVGRAREGTRQRPWLSAIRSTRRHVRACRRRRPRVPSRRRPRVSQPLGGFGSLP